MYQRLLVPLDGSRLAEAVLPIAERLGRLPRSTVVLLHVLERGAPSAIHGERHLQAREEAERYLTDVATRLRAHNVAVETHVHEVPEGDVPRSIAEHAVEERADLIVLCTHGSGGVHQLLFGSVAQQVLKRGTAPVLLARADPDGGLHPFEPDRVLVPLDGTAAAECALEPARELASLLGAGVHLVMVVATASTARGERQAIAQAMPTATRAALELEEAEAGDYLESVAARLRRAGAAVSAEVRRGDTSSALADEAAEPGVGLVVVATHGRAGVQAIWAGSVTARLLARTRAPILLLRMIEP
jgi:nucleotide-binding universal stress UspA family protein